MPMAFAADIASPAILLPIPFCMKNSNIKMAACAAVFLLAGSACAQNYTVKFGAGYVDPRASSTDLQGTVPTPFGPYPVAAGLSLQVQPKTAVLFSVARSFGDHWEAELMMGIPPKHDVKLKVSNALKAQAGFSTLPAQLAYHYTQYDDEVVATVSTIAPTAYINYKFFEPSSAWRPYVGVGLNYTHFNANANDKGTQFYGPDGRVDIHLDDSYGLAFQAGVSYQIDKKWSLNAGWSTIAVKNKLTITTAHSQQTASYDFQPSVFSLMVGYAF